ncbi:MAG: glycosyltransferase family 39 protein [Candidatus Limnocylindrales bacterium]
MTVTAATATGEEPTRWRAGLVGVPPLVLVAAAGMFLVLLAVSGAYGFHRDELYFIVAGRHPALGYVDQPPLTPLLSALSVAVLGLSPTAVRILPALEMALVVILAARMAHDLGGSSRAQVLAAITVAVSGYLAAGHLDDTAELDLLIWAVVVWLLVGLLDGADPRRWLAVGAVVGLGLENKDTLLVLGAGLAVGLILARRWDVLRSPWPWIGLAIAVVIWLPNLYWQATNDWPQITMAGHIAGNDADNRASFLPLLWLLAGPLLFPIALAGLVWMLLSTRARAWRPIPIAALVVVIIVAATGGKAYYAVGTLPIFMAAGAVVLDRWVGRGHAWPKLAAFAVVAALSGAFIAYLTLPILSVEAFAASPLPTTVTDTAEQVGWPQLVATVEGVVAGLPADERSRAVILTTNYGEAGALVLLGQGLPPVYSGHNSFWTWGPPPADRTVVVRVGDWSDMSGSSLFAGCRIVATIDNGAGVPNQEKGKPVSVCSGISQPWSTLWPILRHID